MYDDRVYDDRVYDDRAYDTSDSFYDVVADGRDVPTSRDYDRVYDDRVYDDRVYDDRVYDDRVYDDRVYEEVARPTDYRGLVRKGSSEYEQLWQETPEEDARWDAFAAERAAEQAPARPRPARSAPAGGSRTASSRRSPSTRTSARPVDEGTDVRRTRSA